MKNDELKKKIMDAINATDISVELRRDDIIILADALIAAGIGDVKAAEAEAYRYEMLYKLQNRDMALAERRAHDAEHRAASAERALYKACKDIKDICEYLVKVGETGVITIESYAPEQSEPSAYIDRAEKELGKEGKNERH